MTAENSDTDREADSPSPVCAKVRLYVERAAVPTLGELEGVKLVVETTAGSWFVRLVVLVLLVALAHFAPIPTPW